MTLTLRPSSDRACAFVDDLVADVLAYEMTTAGRKNQRRGIGRDKLWDAVSAFVGAVLVQWSKSVARPVRRTTGPLTFNDCAVGRRQFHTVKDALSHDGLLWVVPGVTWGRRLDWDDGTGAGWHYDGLSSRFWPSQSLLDRARRHGIAPATVKQDFRPIPTTRAPRVPQMVRLKPLDIRQYGPRREAQPPIMTIPAAELERLTVDVAAANTFAAKFNVSGCAPPRWFRTFNGARELGGRWTVAGPEGRYQAMASAERTADITIDGKPVVEIDVAAAHLTILHGLAGVAICDGDPYDFYWPSREIAKLWVLGTLGKGSPVTKWSARMLAGNPILNEHSAKDVGWLAIDRHALLEQPAETVADAAGLHHLAALSTPRTLLTHRLMNIEAEAITLAMQTLRGQGVLAMPVHDSLIVPRDAEPVAMQALQDGFQRAAGIVPRVKVSI